MRMNFVLFGGLKTCSKRSIPPSAIQIQSCKMLGPFVSSPVSSYGRQHSDNPVLTAFPILLLPGSFCSFPFQAGLGGQRSIPQGTVELSWLGLGVVVCLYLNAVSRVQKIQLYRMRNYIITRLTNCWGESVTEDGNQSRSI